jgi:hypothetical protein
MQRNVGGVDAKGTAGSGCHVCFPAPCSFRRHAAITGGTRWAGARSIGYALFSTNGVNRKVMLAAAQSARTDGMGRAPATAAPSRARPAE